jgi:nucleoside-diphosphate-sugar epimerase
MDSKPHTVQATGSSGFIGKHVVRRLTRAGHKVIGYDLIPPKNRFPGRKLELEADRRLPLERLLQVWDALTKAGIPVTDVPARIKVRAEEP